jgi:hypothetical protein
MWQPIETAPKDGTRIIVYRPHFDDKYIPEVGVDRWFENRCWGHSREDCQPTMWQPMPAPPPKGRRQ